MTEVFVALGSNLGDRGGHLRDGLWALASGTGLRMNQSSSFYLTAPVGGPPQPHFVNAVARLECVLTPEQLLDRLHAIELRFGRRRVTRNGPRTLDLDLLLYGDCRWHSDRLQVPHPRLAQRRFVLEPLAEIAPRLRFLGLSLRQHLRDLPAADLHHTPSCNDCLTIPR